jgi:hypothetical protein
MTMCCTPPGIANWSSRTSPWLRKSDCAKGLKHLMLLKIWSQMMTQILMSRMDLI